MSSIGALKKSTRKAESILKKLQAKAAKKRQLPIRKRQSRTKLAS